MCVCGGGKMEREKKGGGGGGKDRHQQAICRNARGADAGSVMLGMMPPPVA